MLAQTSEYWRNYYADHHEARKAEQLAYYKRNRYTCIDRSKRYYQENHEDRLEYHRNYYLSHKEMKLLKSGIWAKTHRAEHNEQTKRSRLKHYDKYLKYHAEYYLNHRDHIKEYRRVHIDTIRETQRIITNRYRTRKRQLEASLTKEQWQAILEAYKYRCAYCGKPSKKLTQDHVIPVSHDGPYVVWNIVPACLPCNSKKRDRTIYAPPLRLML